MKALALMYHDVTPRGVEDSSGFPGDDAARYKIAPAIFESHLAGIARATAAPPALVHVLDRPGEAGLPSRPVFLTFDDGGQSAEAIAAALEATGWRGHFLITTNFIGRPRFLTRAAIRQLRRAGHEVGSHSCSHPLRMASCSPGRLAEEWTRSTRVLSDLLGESIVTASVPGGASSTAVADAAAEAGIRYLFVSRPMTTVIERRGLYIIGRYVVRRGTTAETVAAAARGAWRPWAAQRLLWDVRGAGKRIAGAGYLRLRGSLLGRSPEAIWGDRR